MKLTAFLLTLILAAGLLMGCNKGDKAGNSPVQTSTNTEVESGDRHGAEPALKEICFESQNNRVPVLMFHDLVEERSKTSLWYDCSVKEFKEILDFIKEDGRTVISLKDLYDHLTTGKKVPEKSIVLTFDDNYQSFYDLAWPIVQQEKIPVAMFVHTGFVGKTEGRAKMSWETLNILVKDPLFTVGGHTINHYEDLKDRDLNTQRDELTISKADLEKNLGVKVDFLAYPNGSNGEDTQILAQEAGYKMAVTIVNTPAEESPNIFAVGRYVHTKYKTAIEDADNAIVGAPTEVFRKEWKKDAPVRYVTGNFGGIPLKMVWGGQPTSVMSKTGRQPVKAFVEEGGAVAGINGGFFAMAAIYSADNAMVGPVKTGEMTRMTPDNSPERWVKINDRPMVIWSENEFALLPYIPAQMSKEEQYQYFMKDYTDCFMGGVWLVHKGEARSAEDQSTFAAKDIQDARRRAFIGISKDGEFVAGTATDSVSSAKLAVAIAKAGVEEAVLIDSGFSTSLVFNDKIKATGHSNKDHPSRPVPHAIIIKGKLDATTDDDVDLSSATSLEPGKKSTKKRRKK
jgi:peptidoglycan/xylan/chitin deacetylase (PgdA/CDA1 family)